MSWWTKWTTNATTLGIVETLWTKLQICPSTLCQCEQEEFEKRFLGFRRSHGTFAHRNRHWLDKHGRPKMWLHLTSINDIITSNFCSTGKCYEVFQTSCSKTGSGDSAQVELNRDCHWCHHRYRLLCARTCV